MARPTARVLTLLELLQSGGLRTLAELAGRLGVDERTVRRYVDHLIDLDVPVESVRGRYGGYRLAPGYRMPPLMLADDEALAVLLALTAARRAETTAAAETAAAKIRRVLPARLGRRLDALLETITFTTAASGGAPTPDSTVLLTIADAIKHHNPISIRYADREARRTTRTLHPHALVVHSNRWYVTGAEAAAGAGRTFRLDRIEGARVLPGSFEPPADVDPAQQLLAGFAEAPYRHEVTLRIQATPAQIRTRLPPSVATITESPGTGWAHVEIRAESLDWLPPLLAALDHPFAIDRPAELRTRVAALADRLHRSARRSADGDDPGP
ncbi:helix-turn-helix transcriptional regulator [Winogradskya humida]|uniref:Transcriptional regulator n=1 Tax=Winogradskya humida TaxID=113566 RepID=A0ABQ4A5T7_9ACTN|nr:WYL domain-containing protein [Actinoplanes humidus]GIE26230.1 transcriptional regulator [Actinoplanes humidus]